MPEHRLKQSWTYSQFSEEENSYMWERVKTIQNTLSISIQENKCDVITRVEMILTIADFQKNEFISEDMGWNNLYNLANI